MYIDRNQPITEVFQGYYKNTNMTVLRPSNFSLQVVCIYHRIKVDPRVDGSKLRTGHRPAS